MLGTLTNKNNRLIIKSGFKKIKFESENIQVINSEFIIFDKKYKLNNGEVRVFMFSDSDIIHEGMCHIILRNCEISNDQYDVSNLIIVMNKEHMTRFRKRYSYYSELEKYDSLDVIDIDNLDDIKIDRNINDFDCCCITSKRIEMCGKGIEVKSNSNCLYLLIPNVWHRMNTMGIKTLDIQCESNEKVLVNLLLLRFTPNPVIV